jgi:hypothetical protein
MKPFPSEPMRMWPISTRVNEPEADDPSIADAIERAMDAAKAGWDSSDYLKFCSIVSVPQVFSPEKVVSKMLRHFLLYFS